MGIDVNVSQKKISQKNGGWLNTLLKQYQTSSELELAVGFPRGSEGTSAVYPNGERVVDVAVQQAFGIGVPRRSSLLNANTDLEKVTNDILSGEVKKINAGEQSIDDVLGKLEALSVDIVQASLRSNSETTRQEKASSTPLTDIELMRRSVSSVVRDKQEHR